MSAKGFCEIHLQGGSLCADVGSWHVPRIVFSFFWDDRGQLPVKTAMGEFCGDVSHEDAVTGVRPIYHDGFF